MVKDCSSGGTADAIDSKSIEVIFVWVQVPSRAPLKHEY